MEFGLLVCSILISLYVWGWIRTSIWLLPGIFLPELQIPMAAGFLAFFASAPLFSLRSAVSLDFRSLNKIQKLLWMASSLVIYWALRPHLDESWFAALPFLTLYLFRWFRLPASQILFIPRWQHWLPLYLWFASVVMLSAWG